MLLTVLGIIALSLILSPGRAFASTHTTSTDHSRATNAEKFQMLDEHGEWIENAKFGRVWRPHVAAGWRPFLYGEWDFVDNAWFWDSYEPFGWLVYHYGNWYFIDGTGWVWIPGYVWSPAQVSWFDYDDYIGWCPLAPAGYSFADPWDFGPVIYWNIVLVRDFHHPEIDRHVVRTIQKPQNIKNVVRNAPDIQRIESATNTKIENLKANNATVNEGKHSLKQAQLPKEHIHQTQAFRDRIRREVLVPRMAGKPH